MAATSSGSSARSGTASPASGPGWPPGWTGGGVPSLDDAFRELQLEPVHAPLRAIFADGARAGRARRRRRRPTQVDGPRATVRGVPRGGRRGDRRRPAIRKQSRRRARGRLTRAFAEPPLTAGLTRRDRAALLVWLALARMGELAPGVGCRGDQPSVVRRAAALRARSRPASTTPGWTRPKAGPSPTWSASCWPSRVRRGSGVRSGRRIRGFSRVAGERSRPDRDRPQHLGGRRVRRPGSVRGDASLGGPAGRHRGPAGTVVRDEATDDAGPRRPPQLGCRGGRLPSRSPGCRARPATDRQADTQTQGASTVKSRTAVALLAVARPSSIRWSQRPVRTDGGSLVRDLGSWPTS